MEGPAMTKRKGKVTKPAIDREYPYQAELRLPAGRLRKAAHHGRAVPWKAARQTPTRQREVFFSAFTRSQLTLNYEIGTADIRLQQRSTSRQVCE
jgi:hypothetical protein